MKLSIVYVTYRPGGFDMLADSLRNQTVQDYELIVIDDYKGDRKDIVTKYLLEQVVNLKYIGCSKPKCFQDSYHNFVNALNTGLLASNGDVILLMQDYSWFEPYCLERWFQHEHLFKEKCCIAGIGRYWKNKPHSVVKDLTDPISIWTHHWKGSPEGNGWTDSKMWIGDPLELFYAAIPYEVLAEINGFAEWVDYVHSCFVLVEVFVEQLNKIGARIHTDIDNVCEMVNHKLWQPKETWRTLASNPKGRRIHNQEGLSSELRAALSEAMQGADIPRWWESSKANNWTKLIPLENEYATRPNCFNLKTHIRGQTPWETNKS